MKQNKFKGSRSLLKLHIFRIPVANTIKTIALGKTAQFRNIVPYQASVENY
jgi:hypothetical protein